LGQRGERRWETPSKKIWDARQGEPLKGEGEKKKKKNRSASGNNGPEGKCSNTRQKKKKMLSWGRKTRKRRPPHWGSSDGPEREQHTRKGCTGRVQRTHTSSKQLKEAFAMENKKKRKAKGLKRTSGRRIHVGKN